MKNVTDGAPPLNVCNDPSNSYTRFTSRFANKFAGSHERGRDYLTKLGTGMADRVMGKPSPNSLELVKQMVVRASGRLVRFDMHYMLSLPLFVIIAGCIILQLLCYIVIKLISKAVEEALTPVAVRDHRAKMGVATTYGEYLKHASALDETTKRNKWKSKKKSRSYDWRTVEAATQHLEEGMRTRDIELIISILTNCLTPKFGGILKEELYSRTYVGTKHLVEEYLHAVERACLLLEGEVTGGSSRKAQIRGSVIEWNSQWGMTSLVLSGGAMLAGHHFGVIETLLGLGLIPKVVSGTSAGAAIAAWVCTRTDDELREQLNIEYIADRFRVFPPYSNLARCYNLIRNGYASDVDSFQEKGLYLCSDITFLEAFKRTGRILNISLSSADSEHSHLVVNYKNAPNVLVYSVVIASSAFPKLVPPLALKERQRNGDITEASSLLGGQYFHDGSLQEDVPCVALKEAWGVRFNIVSQVNLHVFPFCGLRAHGEAGMPVTWRGGAGRWRAGFVLSALEMFFKENLRFLFRLITVLDVSPTFEGINFGKLAVQSYIGDITFHPRRTSWRHFYYLFADLPTSAWKWLIQEGRLMVCPKVSLIESRLRIERSITRLFDLLFNFQSTPTWVSGPPTTVNSFRARLRDPSAVSNYTVMPETQLRPTIETSMEFKDPHTLSSSDRLNRCGSVSSVSSIGDFTSAQVAGYSQRWRCSDSVPSDDNGVAPQRDPSYLVKRGDARSPSPVEKARESGFIKITK
eukprot:GHVN01056356.1.p1 GENE.GHVN01056356.1~~GHVN01056356.1.p1  ORF type:complete len:749 (-),score=93.00 GHVN01056356.1:2367-4613(-)